MSDPTREQLTELLALAERPYHTQHEQVMFYTLLADVGPKLAKAALATPPGWESIRDEAAAQVAGGYSPELSGEIRTDVREVLDAVVLPALRAADARAREAEGRAERAVAEEREACAKAAEDACCLWRMSSDDVPVDVVVTAAIRARSAAPPDARAEGTPARDATGAGEVDDA
jgi:hypothetical protein